MGQFVALEDPRAEPMIEAHLARIVAAIRSRMEPMAIILRGSFARGEGSVFFQDGRLCFLSDYEIDIATVSPFYRSLFRRLSRDLTAELDVSVSMRWIRPDFMRRHRIGPIAWGPAPVTISLYDSRYGSRTLYGQDLIQAGPPVDPGLIQAESGLDLLLNRMAESLFYMRSSGPSAAGNLMTYHWINKTILACAESLLVLWKSYHYSSAERGRRFAEMAGERLGFMEGREEMLSNLVARATEFKLRPRRDLYPGPTGEAWAVVIDVVGPVFRHLAEQILGIRYHNIEEFARQYLECKSNQVKHTGRPQTFASKAVDIYRSARARRVPWGLGLLKPFIASHLVYAVVPLVFLSYRREQRATTLAEVRRQLRSIDRLSPPSQHADVEWESLRQRVSRNWKIYCHG